MTMRRILQIIIWPVLLAPAAYLALAWKNIPASVPMHYNLRGEVDRWGDKKELILLVCVLAVVSLGTYLLLNNLHKFDPKRKSAEPNKPRMRILGTGIAIFISALSLMLVYYSAHPGMEMKSNFIFVGVGLLFAFLGNYMHSIKPNYFAGIRLPWTLENEENWRLTHTLAGKLWFAGGLLIAIVALFATPTITFIVFIVTMLLIVGIPAVYSYRLFKKQKMQSL